MNLIKSIIFVSLTLLTFNIQLASAEENWSKYPDNSAKNFQDVDSFYDSLDKKSYKEFENAKLNIREKTYFKDINKVYAKADKYGKSRVTGEGTHPKRQVYVFVTVSEEGNKILTSVFDAETQRLIASASNFEREKPHEPKMGFRVVFLLVLYGC
jgi:ABC-type uncharacterized transport system substrate-binding protein